MLKLQSLFVLILFIHYIYLCGAVSLHGAQCEDEMGRIFNQGQSYRMRDSCVQYICIGHDTWRGMNCPALDLPPSCVISEEDLTKPFPGCCMRPSCSFPAHIKKLQQIHQNKEYLGNVFKLETDLKIMAKNGINNNLTIAYTPEENSGEKLLTQENGEDLENGS